MVPKKIAISVGEPAGIGPDILIQTVQKQRKDLLIAYADPDLIAERARLLKLPLKLTDPESKDAYSPGTLSIVPHKLALPCRPGMLNPENSEYVLKCLNAAMDSCVKNETEALVTAPIQKSVIRDANIKFTGHTEYLANKLGTSNQVMMLASDHLRVALVTTHIPLNKVSNSITKEKLIRTIKILNTDLINKFQISKPKILVCGLNPHAGESGYLGTEETKIITPTLRELSTLGIDVVGPLSADTIFNEVNIKQADAFVAMYHDQGLPVIKSLNFGEITNITLGLPIIRTSVDHGTALDLAGTGKSIYKSFEKAVHLASELARNRNESS
ncbi:MAG: 4-hydroxythreonine-4-phosphate dehydrogenase PdxA [Porticoccaceae bacterium]|nr:4-hydroxythreonine-4-phosphate dehydrogenase PdxA [Porticoccaceae bacterium]|tara:strand:- start:902 stop:1888 length:987 start_codon:yes stop_codon:yes gene_type:complete